jgi:transposase InsO family protein
VLRAVRLSRMEDVDPKPPARRYKCENPGDMIHLDIRKLGCFDRVGHRITGDRRGQSSGRGIGWEPVHVCVDDASRIAFTDAMPNENAVGAIAFRDVCRELSLEHIWTQPYTPQTNGKA